MNPPASAAGSTRIACVACQHANDPSAKFCASCGHSLYESCIQCGKPVLLDQKFCGSCGADLNAAVQKHRAQLESWMAMAIDKTKQNDFKESLALLNRVANQTDVRYRDLADHAKKAIEKVEGISNSLQSDTQQRLQLAQQAFQSRQYTQVVESLSKVSESLLTEEAQRILRVSRHHVDQVSALRGELSERIEHKDWATAGHLLEQLLELVPGDPKYTKLAQQAAGKLIKSVSRRAARHDYLGALAKLEAIPEFCRDDEHATELNRIRNIHWLASQFEPEPYATATLGRIAVRYSKDSPHDGRATQLVNDLAARLKKAPQDQRRASPSYLAPPTAWLGGDAALFALPKSIDTQAAPDFRRRPGRFAVATGLALQGLGLARIDRALGMKKRLLGGLGGRGRTTCWGIDIGTSTIHAVLLRKEKSDDRPVVVQTYFAELESPVCRVGNDQREPVIIKAAIEKMLETIDVGDTDVFSSFSSSQVVSRFLTLPPVKDKMVANLIEQETRQQIPIPIEDLDVVTYVGQLGEDESKGRPALIAAAKKHLVQIRMDLLKDSGLNVVGLQNESVALVNFAAFEFQDVFEEEIEPVGGVAKVPSVALIDAGASSTRLAFVSAEHCWYWTIDSGSEELTSVLARISQQTKEEAEKLKCNPAALPKPADMYDPVEQKLAALRGRLERIAGEGLGENEHFQVQQTWCFGGACLAHAWIRRVMLAATS
ncbi:pilus assembly protein PilM [Crateriforma conspicua]|uniref:Competence protein A n=1 Tax=Crateriforma conspicua TaxID=2527996 RepID=A0A5C5XSG5_9PLAN|nr:pilus assembly protein PilM [Crateriforma conspicua]TWT65854.1 Competence protein A [Crateriforma conspicua]